MNALLQKRPLTGGRMSDALKTYQVRGWLRGADRKMGLAVMQDARVPLSRVESIRALSPIEAAKVYARCHAIRESLWNDGTNRPYCVIRVSDASQQEP